jgi:CheY-like chemotaxis protein
MSALARTATDQLPAAIKNRSLMRLLVVEDDALIALIMTDQVAALGYAVVGPASTMSEARHLAKVASIDGALLDLNLNGVWSHEIAEILSQRKIPFLFVTGYNKLPPDSLYANIDVLRKPFQSMDLMQAVETVLAKRSPRIAVTALQRR